ncbi:MAG: 50S ribosomal protein L32e, partial [Nitrososphaeraceae archaeon]|nr:50S ribosomal protein L32e [Nitrososphaeraceae archaeon]
MVINKELLQLRKKIADKRPDFVRQESWRYKKLATNWRKPKGKDNKMRKQVSGVPALVKVGYKGPRKSRGLHPSGYNDVLIFNTNDLTRIDPKIDAIRIAHGVGYKKRLDILNEATKLKIKVLNPGKIEKVEKVETKPKKEVEKVEKEKAEAKPKKEVEKVEKEKAEVKPKKEVEKVEKEKAEVKPKKEKGKSIGKKVS